MGLIPAGDPNFTPARPKKEPETDDIYIFQAKREASIGKPWTRKVNYSIIKEPINRKKLCSHSMIIAEGATLGTINQSNVSRHFVIDVCRDIG